MLFWFTDNQISEAYEQSDDSINLLDLMNISDMVFSAL